MTVKEAAFSHCALMILNDQCPPDRRHYLCMREEDDTADCTQCWSNYIWGMIMGKIELDTTERRL